MIRPSSARGGAVALAVVLAASCAPSPEDGPPAPSTATPEATALALFALADSPARDRLSDVLSEGGIGADPESALDALDGLRDIDDLRVVAAEGLDVADRWVVDVEGSRVGPTLVAFSVQVEPAPDGTWRVAWFAGPGVEWPGRTPEKPGLATSPVPDAPSR